MDSLTLQTLVVFGRFPCVLSSVSGDVTKNDVEDFCYPGLTDIMENEAQTVGHVNLHGDTMENKAQNF